MTASQSRLFRHLVALAVPVMGLNLLTVLSMVVDTAMCGHLENADAALAGLGFASQLLMVMTVSVMGLTVGVIAIVSRSFGAGEYGRVNHTLAQSTTLVILVGVGIAVLGYATCQPLIRALGGEGDSLEQGVSYFRIFVLGSPAQFSMIALAGVLRGVGETRTAFLSALVANVVNIALNYCLILGRFGFPALGVEGAALGTVISQVVNVSLLVFAMRRGVVEGLILRAPPLRIDPRMVGAIIRVGWPAAADMVVFHASLLSIVAILGHIDSDAVAAHAIGMRLQSLAVVPGVGVAQATAAIVGQSLGAENVDRARLAMRASLILCTGILAVLGTAVVLAAHPVLQVFDVRSGSELEAYAIDWIRILGLSMPIFAVNIVLVGLFQGAGSPRTYLKVNVISNFFVQIPLSAVLAFPLGMGAVGAWIAFPASALFRIIILSQRYWTLRWAVTGVER